MTWLYILLNVVVGHAAFGLSLISKWFSWHLRFYHALPFLKIVYMTLQAARDKTVHQEFNF